MTIYSSYSLSIYQPQRAEGMLPENPITEGSAPLFWATLDSEKAIIERVRALSDEAAIALDEYGCSGEDIQWDTCLEDVATISLDHPDFLFVLHEVDQFGYAGKSYIQNGEYTQVEPTISWPDFDKAQLQPLPNFQPDPDQSGPAAMAGQNKEENQPA